MGTPPKNSTQTLHLDPADTPPPSLSCFSGVPQTSEVFCTKMGTPPQKKQPDPRVPIEDAAASGSPDALGEVGARFRREVLAPGGGRAPGSALEATSSEPIAQNTPPPPSPPAPVTLDTPGIGTNQSNCSLWVGLVQPSLPSQQLT